MTSSKKKVFVGLSGGVDSAVSAAILKEQGYDVTGVFIKVWTPDWLEEETARKEVCTWREDRRDALRVAAHLDIPFLTLNLEDEYKRDVVDYMVSEYKAGRVPNPDVMCNKQIKFGAFLEFAKKNRADYIATGHYARTRDNDLLKGVDENKDQSYFLWTLTQDQLAHALFPIGEHTKPEVRKLAKKFGLPNADKKDSQGLCFVGKVDMKEFLKHFVEEKRGGVLNEKGEAIGTHDGAIFFTIGQRHGFNITKKGTSDTPYYVVDKNAKRNTITVSHNKKEDEFAQDTINLEQVSWVSGEPQEKGRYQARLWYRGPLIPCHVTTHDGATQIELEEAQPAAAGQSLVVYGGEIVLGGGIMA